MWWLWYNLVLPYLHTLTHTQSWTGRGWVLRFLCCIPHSRLMPWCETFPISCSSQVSVWLETNVFTGKLKISYIHLLSSSYFQCFSTAFLYCKDRYVGLFFFFFFFANLLQIYRLIWGYSWVIRTNNEMKCIQQPIMQLNSVWPCRQQFLKAN